MDDEQIVAVQTKVGGAAGTFYFTYTDHLGNVAALSWTGGTFVPGSLAAYDPFGTLTTPPGTNPSITNHGFTGHRHNNTGSNDLGLIYMNARYYLPQVGRFVSPDSVVPDPANPQSYNRYSYVLNSPMNYSDPTGHMVSSGCGGHSEGCTVDDELDPNRTYINNDNSPVLADPALLEQYPAELTAAELAYGVTGLGVVVFVAPIVIESAAAALPSMAGGGSVACADGDCTNEITSAAQYAQNLQGKGRYPGIDQFAETTIKQGELLIGAAEKHGRTAFYTTIDSFVRSGRSAEALWQGLQVAPDEIYGYRQAVTVYRAISDIPAAVGQALANPQYGPGGYTQVVIEGFQDVLEPIISILLK